jgi:ribosomal protein S18 acetylase RimI-like enzyme
MRKRLKSLLKSALNDTKMETIRQVSPEDAEGVYKVFRDTWLATYPNVKNNITVEDIISKYPQNKQIETVARYRKFYEKIAANPDDSTTSVWVATENGQVVGVVTLDKEIPVRIGAVYVLPDYQGHGVGKKLMEFILEKVGHQEVVLNVAKYNTRAIKFYENFGFRIMGEVNDPNGQLPKVKMVKAV